MMTDDRRHRSRAYRAAHPIGGRPGRPRVTLERKRAVALAANLRYRERHRDELQKKDRDRYHNQTPEQRDRHRDQQNVRRAAQRLLKPRIPQLTPDERLIQIRERWRRNRAIWKAANHEKALLVDRTSRQRHTAAARYLFSIGLIEATTGPYRNAALRYCREAGLL